MEVGDVVLVFEAANVEVWRSLYDVPKWDCCLWLRLMSMLGSKIHL